jgi:hypothetical protein
MAIDEEFGCRSMPVTDLPARHFQRVCAGIVDIVGMGFNRNLIRSQGFSVRAASLGPPCSKMTIARRLEDGGLSTFGGPAVQTYLVDARIVASSARFFDLQRKSGSYRSRRAELLRSPGAEVAAATAVNGEQEIRCG